MLRPASSWLAEAWAVLAKDWRAEFRSRYALSTLLLFALTMLVVVTLALGPVGATPAQKLTVPPVVLWLILLFAAASGVPRAFVHEEESRTAIALRLAATPSAVFVGKFAFVASLVAALEIVVTPLLLAVLQADVDRPATLVAVLAAGASDSPRRALWWPPWWRRRAARERCSRCSPSRSSSPSCCSPSKARAPRWEGLRRRRPRANCSCMMARLRSRA